MATTGYGGNVGGTAGQQAAQQAQSELGIGSPAPPPAPAFSGPFGGLEHWFYSNVEQPIVGYIGADVSPLYSELGRIAPAIESDLPEIASVAEGARAGIAGVALSLATQIPQVKSAISDVRSEETKLGQSLQSVFGAGISKLEGDISGIGSSVESGFKSFGQELNVMQSEIVVDLANVGKYASELEKEAPTIELIEKQVGGFPGDLIDFWDTYAMPDIKKAIGDITPELTALGSDISTLSSKIKGLATEIENLPSEVEAYVEKGVETELNKLWKKIELPAIAIGGLLLYKMFYPSCPNCSTSKPKHIKTPVIG